MSIIDEPFAPWCQLEGPLLEEQLAKARENGDGKAIRTLESIKSRMKSLEEQMQEDTSLD